jgi:two-component system CheB/CheR fusion protein
MTPRFRIVSLCGSAGALAAYVEILQAVPIDSGFTFVVLTHRRIERHSWLVDILSRATPISVEEIVDGLSLKPNCVYVIPAGKDLTIDGTAFALAPPRTTYGLPDTFDVYLESVARTTSRRAVTVILSGVAQDGSAFLKQLRQSGGINYAQSGAQTSSMPDSAIATGMIDYIGSAKEIAVAILDLSEVDKQLARQ